MLTSEQISAYFENGYLLVENVVTPEQLQRMQEITHEFIDRSKHVTASNDVYDLDEGHNSETPKLTPDQTAPQTASILLGCREEFWDYRGPTATGWTQCSFTNIQAQRKGAGRRGCCRVAPGLGILSSYQRRHVGLRCLSRGHHGGKWAASGHSGIS